jgi:mono/diheme cytochrome c family protein
MKTLFATILLFTCVVAAAETTPKKNSRNDEDYQAAKILTHHCAGCHQAADHPGALFLNQARLNEVETIDLISDLLEHNRMPPAHQDFKKTTDGKQLLKWLKEKRKQAAKAK